MNGCRKDQVQFSNQNKPGKGSEVDKREPVQYTMILNLQN